MRTEYDEPLYTRLALEALEAWRDPEWEGIFHETVRLLFPFCEFSINETRAASPLPRGTRRPRHFFESLTRTSKEKAKILSLS